MQSQASAVAAARSGDSATPSRIADRYRILERLTQGGMGEILVAVDETTGERVALKRLLGKRGFTAAMLFEREYRTLASLKHPCIVRVFDYGIDETPFYTMELLDGQDLTRVAPLPYREACRYMRDVASSLALLHARHLLHRDVSPRNVRITSEGRCKLLDFGALSSFGLPDEMIGTPPGMPPEAIYGLPLDQRLDLYAVGALGYWLLTGRHAYPTRDPRELPSLWAMPVVPPSSFAEGLPESLEQLILSLLSQDRTERPSTAAEVMDQLSAIAGLAPEEHAEVVQAYLTVPRLIGRKKDVELIKAAILGAVRSRGASVMVEGLVGMGKTRLVDEATLAARVAGTVVVRIDAEIDSSPFGVPLALAAALLGAAPTTAREAAERDAAFLSHLVPGLAVSRPSGTVEVTQNPGERRAQIQRAFHRWVMEFARRSPLVVLCDNVHAADQGSLGFLLGLARQVEGSKLFLLSTWRTDEPTSDADALGKLREASELIDLSPLGTETMKELARALFGDVPNVGRFAEWLDAGAAGSPLHAIELSRYAIAERLVRYEDGAWLLPAEIPEGALEFGKGGITTWTLGKLLPEARLAAEALSIHGKPLCLELCASLTSDIGKDVPLFALLDPLVEAGILVIQGSDVRFVRTSVRKQLFDALEPERKKRLHRTLAEALLATGRDDFATLNGAGWHLIHAGDETRGADLLARKLASTDERTLVVENDFHAAVPGLEAAYAVYKAQGRSVYERAPLLVALLGAGYYVDWRLAQRYGDEGIAVMSEALGLRTALWLQRFLGKKLGLIAGIIVGGVRFARAKDRQGTFKNLFSTFLSCVTFLVGISLIKLEAANARRYADVLAPFRVLGEKLAPAGIAEYCEYLALFADNQLGKARDGFRKLVERLNDARYYTALNGESRKLFLGGALFALGVLEVFRDTGDALNYADTLEGQGFAFYDIVGGRLRISHHAYRGEMDRIPKYRERLELHAIQYGSAWQVEVWAPASFISVYANIGHVSGLKAVTENLRTLSRDLPHFQMLVSVAEATLALLRGDAAKAVEILEELRSSGRLAVYPGRHSSLGTLAVAYNQLGQHEKARAFCEELLGTLTDEDREFVVFSQKTEIQLALAEAAMGDTARAAQRVDRLIEKYGTTRGPATLALLHQGRARVALLSRDAEACQRHTEAMGEYARLTNNPFLIAQWKRLARKGQRATFSEDARSLMYHSVGGSTSGLEQSTIDDEATDIFDDADTAASAALEATTRKEAVRPRDA